MHKKPPFRPIFSKPALLLAALAVGLPFLPLLSHRLDALALAALPLALLAAHIEHSAYKHAAASPS